VVKLEKKSKKTCGETERERGLGSVRTGREEEKTYVSPDSLTDLVDERIPGEREKQGFVLIASDEDFGLQLAGPGRQSGDPGYDLEGSVQRRGPGPIVAAPVDR
jgi:hypothetical protein